MKVLFIFHDSERNNGANRSMMDVIDYLAENASVEPYIAFPKKSGTAIDYAHAQNYHVYLLRYGRWDFPVDKKGFGRIKYAIKWSVKLMATPCAYLKLAREIKREGIQLLYTNTYTTFLGAWLSHNYKIPHIWHIREFGKEDHNFKILFGDKVLYKGLNRDSDAIFFISNSIRNKYIPLITNTDKCYTLYNDICSVGNKLLERWNDTSNYNLLIAGTLQEGKGQLEAVQAIEIVVKQYGLKNIKLHIAGKRQGSYYEKVKKYVEENDLKDHIEFCGFVSEMGELRDKMHIGLVCSANEAFGRVTIEGMLSGMFMIGANTAGTSELIEDYKTGRLYPLHDKNILASIIADSIEDIDNTKRIALEGFQYAKDAYASNRTSRRIGEIMESLVDNIGRAK